MNDTIPNLSDEEMTRLKATTSEIEWNAACDAIKKARGGQYPKDWWDRVMMSGLANAIQQNWK